MRKVVAKAEATRMESSAQEMLMLLVTSAFTSRTVRLSLLPLATEYMC